MSDITIPTPAQLYQIGMDQTKADQALLPPDQRLTIEPLSQEDFILGNGATMAWQAMQIGLQLAMRNYASTCLALATQDGGDALEGYFTDRWPTMPARYSANYAKVYVVLQRPNADKGVQQITTAFTCSTLADALTGTKLQYQATKAFTFNGTISDPIELQCTQVGRLLGQNCGEGAVVNIDTPLPDTSIYIQGSPGDPAYPSATKHQKASGGAEKETPEKYYQRGIAFPATLRKGTVPAIIAGALNVPGIRHAAVTQHVAETDPFHYVDVTVADDDGPVNDQLLRAVDDELPNWVCAGVPWNKHTASYYDNCDPDAGDIWDRTGGHVIGIGLKVDPTANNVDLSAMREEAIQRTLNYINALTTEQDYIRAEHEASVRQIANVNPQASGVSIVLINHAHPSAQAWNVRPGPMKILRIDRAMINCTVTYPA